MNAAIKILQTMKPKDLFGGLFFGMMFVATFIFFWAAMP